MELGTRHNKKTITWNLEQGCLSKADFNQKMRRFPHLPITILQHQANKFWISSNCQVLLGEEKEQQNHAKKSSLRHTAKGRPKAEGSVDITWQTNSHYKHWISLQKPEVWSAMSVILAIIVLKARLTQTHILQTLNKERCPLIFRNKINQLYSLMSFTQWLTFQKKKKKL